MSEHAFGGWSGLRTGLSYLSSLLLEVGILVLVGVWAVIWIFLSEQTAATEGLLNGTIIGVYSLLPVAAVLLWRLSLLTSFELPRLTDFVETPETQSSADDGSKSAVAKRFETGGDAKK